MITPEKQVELLTRGCVEVITDEELVDKIKRKGRLTVKYGADPSAPDLHLGHSIPLRKLRQFQELGHRVIFIIGDFTAMIGDPTGVSSTRRQLSREEVQANAQTYLQQVGKILDLEKTEVVFNSQWFSRMSLEELINSLASKYTLARILERDDFATRFKNEKPIYIHELLYPLMQGYDSLMISADVEIGGTDQKFNMLVGRELQREVGQEPQIVMTLPLLEGLDGVAKMSKSLNNYVGLTEPPDVMFGKLMSISDELMWRYIELLTDTPPQEIEALKRKVGEGRLNPMEVKMKLAFDIVAMYHNEQLAQQAKREFEKVFRQRDIPSKLEEVVISKDYLKDGKLWVVKLLVLSGFVNGAREAKRLISQGAVRINKQQISNPDEDIVIEDGMVVQIGKRKFFRVVLGE
ncbi:tyrosine--tRNA ligase [bacterium]|nr:tyrosine--tRNA ligase [bacterium]